MSEDKQKSAYSKALEKWEIEIGALTAKHDAHHFEINGSMNAYAQLGIKSLYLLNGGALSLIPIYVSMLGIPAKQALAEFNFIILPFGVSILLTAFCNLSSYFTEGERAEATNKQFELDYKNKELSCFGHILDGASNQKIKDETVRLQIQAKASLKTWATWRYMSISLALLAVFFMLVGFCSLIRFILSF